MVTLRPTGTIGINSGTPVIAGPEPQWADDSDTSYVAFTINGTGSGPEDDVVTDLPLLSASAGPFAGMWLRARLAADADPDLLALNVLIYRNSPYTEWYFGNSDPDNFFRFQADGVTRKVDGTLAFGDEAELVAALIAGDCELNVYTSQVGTSGSPPSTVTVYEIGFDFGVRLTRMYPLDTGTNMSSAPRIYPPSKADVIFGGYR